MFAIVTLVRGVFRKSNLLGILALCGLLAFLHGTAVAATRTWNGSFTPDPTNWNEYMNWDTGFVPVPGDDVVIPGGFVVNHSSGTTTVNSVTIANSSTVNLSGGTFDGGTLTGAGTLNWTGGMLSGGTYNLSSAQGLVINAGTAKELYNTVTNAGTMTLAGDGLTFLANNNGYLNNQGNLIILGDFAFLDGGGAGTRLITNTGTITKSGGAGTTSINVGFNNNNPGIINVQSGTLDFNSTLNHASGAFIYGIGTIDVTDATFTNNGNTNPGHWTGGNLPGILTISGNYPMTASTVLNIERGGLAVGTEYDRLVVSGAVTLNGTLVVELIYSFPNVGDTYTILTASSITGSFLTQTLPVVSGITWNVVNDGTNLILQAISDWDIDGDWMDDDWEILYFGDLSRDGTLDLDNDGQSDKYEYGDGTDPTNPDSDGDGQLDGAEVCYGSDPNDIDSTFTTPIIASSNSRGYPGNSLSYFVTSTSSDGRYVAFDSFATNLDLDFVDTNATWDVFLKDIQTAKITYVSTDSSGVLGNLLSGSPAISGNGRYVVFRSAATNLVTGDTNGFSDIFRKDIQTGVTTLVSSDSAGGFVNNESSRPRISSDGRYVVFESAATNLVPDDTNGYNDIFLKDTSNGAITLLSRDSSGTIGNGISSFPSISSDGTYAVFHSAATNLVTGDTNGFPDVFIKNIQTGAVTLVSSDSSLVIGNNESNDASISSDGRYVAFLSLADNMVAGDVNGDMDVFIKDTQTGITTLVSSDSAGTFGNQWSYGPSISGDGRYVAFYSYATNLVADVINTDTHVFIKDTQTGAIALVDKNNAGVVGDYNSLEPAISSDGRYVAFESEAANLIPWDNNYTSDIFWTVNPVYVSSSSFTVTPSAGINGSISPNTPQSVEADATTAFIITPNANYLIDSVSGCGGSLVGSTYTTAAITANCTVTASFVIQTFTVTPVAGTGGSISPSTPQTVNSGSGTIFTITPNAGYDILDVTGCGGSMDGDYYIGSVTADCTVTASFILQTFTVTPSAGANGTISPVTPQTVNYGSSRSFTITPNSGFVIDAVSGCGGSLAGNTYTTAAVTADCTVTASFVVQTFTVTPSAGAGGSINPAIAQILTYGATTSFTVTPIAHYLIDSVGGTCGGSLVGNTFTTSAVTADCTVTASFVIETFTITPSAGSGGSISPATAQVVDYDGSASFTFTPVSGYRILDVLVDSVSQGAVATYVFSNIQADHTVAVTFAAIPVTPGAGSGWVDGAVFSASVPLVTLTSSPFSSPSSDSHASTTWRVRRADQPYSDYANVTYIAYPGLTSHEITSGLVDGLKYSWQVQYASSLGITSDWSEEYNFIYGSTTTDNGVQVDAGTTQADYKMTSIVQWPSNPAATAVFGTALGGSYDTTKFRIGTYDPFLGAYITYDTGLTIEPGRAFWFLSRNGANPAIQGVPVSVSSSIDVELFYNSITGDGWNMIAPPNNADYYWVNVEIVVYDGSGNISYGPIPIQSLSDPNLYIDLRLWNWQAGVYDPSESLLLKYSGYWVKAKQANVYLRFPFSAQTNLSRFERMYAGMQQSGNSLSRYNPFTPALAYATDSDAPPMPMGDFNADPNSDLLGKGEGCFIATAAYGSYLDPEVLHLRRFRDNCLKTNAPGRWFVQAYYKYSPPFASFIADHDGLRSAARIALTPLVYSVKYPVYALMMIFGMCLGMVGYLGYVVINSRRRYASDK